MTGLVIALLSLVFLVGYVFGRALPHMTQPQQSVEDVYRYQRRLKMWFVSIVVLYALLVGCGLVSVYMSNPEPPATTPPVVLDIVRVKEQTHPSVEEINKSLKLIEATIREAQRLQKELNNLRALKPKHDRASSGASMAKQKDMGEDMP